jgi:two-component system NtrC family response regulator
LKVLEKYPWPGNVRELENKVKRGVVMADSSIIEPVDLGFKPNSTDQPPEGIAGTVGGELDLEGLTLKEARGLVEKSLLVRAMERETGNVSRAADSLGLTRPTFYDLLKKHGLFVSSSDQDT